MSVSSLTRMVGARAEKTSKQGPASVEPPFDIEAGLALAQWLESSSLAIQAFRAQILKDLAGGNLSREESTSLKGALAGLRDFEKHIQERETPIEIAAMQKRLDALEAAQSGVQGFAQRSSSAVTPPEPTREATH